MVSIQKQFCLQTSAPTQSFISKRLLQVQKDEELPSQRMVRWLFHIQWRLALNCIACINQHCTSWRWTAASLNCWTTTCNEYMTISTVEQHSKVQVQKETWKEYDLFRETVTLWLRNCYVTTYVPDCRFSAKSSYLSKLSTHDIAQFKPGSQPHFVSSLLPPCYMHVSFQEKATSRITTAGYSVQNWWWKLHHMLCHLHAPSVTTM